MYASFCVNFNMHLRDNFIYNLYDQRAEHITLISKRYCHQSHLSTRCDTSAFSTAMKSCEINAVALVAVPSESSICTSLISSIICQSNRHFDYFFYQDIVPNGLGLLNALVIQLSYSCLGLTASKLPKSTFTSSIMSERRRSESSISANILSLMAGRK